MRGADLRADARGALGDDGVGERDDVDAAIEHAVGEGLGDAGVAEHDRDDGVGAVGNVESGGAEFFAVVACVGGEAVAEFGGTGDEVEGGDGGGGDHGSEGVGEQVGARTLAEERDDFAAAADVAAAGAAEGFAERAGKDVDATEDVAELGRAATGAADEADGVAVVDHHEGVVLVGEIADGAQRRDGAVHGEHAVGGDELEACAVAGGAVELGGEIGDVGVAVAIAAGFGEADAVDDGGVVEFVADDGVVGGEQGFEDAGVGVEAGRVEDRVVGLEEGAEAGFEFAVDFLGAADESDGGKAVAPAVEGGVGGGDEIGVVGEAEIVVGAEVEDGAAVGGAKARALRSREDTLMLAQTGGIDVVERCPQVGAKGGSHGKKGERARGGRKERRRRE